MSSERREIHYSGRVQGVGFRYTTREIAARFPVVGFVKNLSDGRVLLVVEGESGPLDEFISVIDDELGRFVTGKDVQASPSTGEFATFEVRR